MAFVPVQMWQPNLPSRPIDHTWVIEYTCATEYCCRAPALALLRAIADAQYSFLHSLPSPRARPCVDVPHTSSCVVAWYWDGNTPARLRFSPHVYPVIAAGAYLLGARR